MQTKLTREQLDKLAQFVGCTKEDTQLYIEGVDKIELLAEKLKEKVGAEAMWDIFMSLEGYKDAKKHLGKGTSSEKAFDVEYHALDLAADWEQIKEDEEVKELLKDDDEAQRLLRWLN